MDVQAGRSELLGENSGEVSFECALTVFGLQKMSSTATGMASCTLPARLRVRAPDWVLRREAARDAGREGTVWLPIGVMVFCCAH